MIFKFSFASVCIGAVAGMDRYKFMVLVSVPAQSSQRQAHPAVCPSS